MGALPPPAYAGRVDVASPVAILVEDDAEQVPKARKIFEDAGFRVEHFYDEVTALAGVQEFAPSIRLIVLDRRLPTELGHEPEDVVGDRLLSAVVASHRDVPLLVFSGFSDYDHLQRSSRNQGSIVLRGGAVEFDRVTVLRKGQAPEARAFAKSVSQMCAQIDAVEILTQNDLVLKPQDRWLLKRVAFEYSAQAARVSALSGGATEADVWRCAFERRDGAAADYVVKRTKKRGGGDGLQALLPAGVAAATVNCVEGLSGGLRALVIQAAGSDPVPLDKLVISDPTQALAVLTRVIAELDSVPPGNLTHRPLREIVEAFSPWEQLVENSEKYGFELPPDFLEVTTRWSQQHGDLHPGNVLVVDGNPILIDFESQTTGSRLLDPVALLLGGVFHRASAIRASGWPSADVVSTGSASEWGVEAPFSDVVERIVAWIHERDEGPREAPAVLLAFASRQLGFDDVRRDPRLTDAAVALARVNSELLRES